MSSLNIELVHIILTAVSQRTVGTAKHETNFLVYQSYDFNNKNEFVIDYIEINDRKEWDVEVVLSDGKQPSLTAQINDGLTKAFLPRFQSFVNRTPS